MKTDSHRGVKRFILPMLLAMAGVLCVAPAPARAAEKTLEQRIAELERKVAEMEAMLAKTHEGGGTQETAELRRQLDIITRELEKLRIGEAAAPRELTSVHGLGPAASKVYGVQRGVSIGGYGEALAQDFDAQRDDGERTGRAAEADLLRAVLYFGYKFDDRIVFNSEI
ncbi:MAG TPA: hypothetical protein VFG76_00390, partial [Candidatus Polarisedimenticolia bacterium]|nr:hypothetical protein [Candidatus Polarisedimenticolia bacterium]